MQVTVDIPDELAAQVRARGLTLDCYVASLLAKDLGAQPQELPKPSISAAIDHLQSLRNEIAQRRHAAVDRMIQFASTHEFTTGGDDLKAMVHEGHKY